MTDTTPPQEMERPRRNDSFYRDPFDTRSAFCVLEEDYEALDKWSTSISEASARDRAERDAYRKQWNDCQKLLEHALNEEQAELRARIGELEKALEEQVRGAEWRKENESENWNGADDEALERAKAALEAKHEASGSN